MNSVLPFLAVLLLTPAAPAEEPAPAASPPLHFRLEVGVEPGHVVEGCLVESGEPGSGRDAALLDLDGDGSPETRRPFAPWTRSRTGREMRDARLGIRQGDAVWVLELDALASPGTTRAIAAGTTRVHWSAQDDHLLVRFMESPLTLHASAEAARVAPPFRMGPPLRLVPAASTRGPNALVTLALMDPNGGKLATVLRDGKEHRPAVAVFGGGEPVATGSPGYS